MTENKRYWIDGAQVAVYFTTIPIMEDYELASLFWNGEFVTMPATLFRMGFEPVDESN